jgi:hypothetical protein
LIRSALPNGKDKNVKPWKKGKNQSPGKGRTIQKQTAGWLKNEPI